VQVVKYIARKTVVVKHVGSAGSDQDLSLLRQAAFDWIQRRSGQKSLFPDLDSQKGEPAPRESDSPVLILNQSELISTSSVFVYEELRKFCIKLGFTRGLRGHPGRELLLDLVVVRLIHPASKLESLQYLQDHFQITYARHFLYRQMLKWGTLKDDIEGQVVKFAKRRFDFDFRIVFYDVTTLYFETSKTDLELRQCGFSKDHKFNQPQLIIGLVVNEQGFPISYGIFPGNKFEGHTLIPVIESLRNRYHIKKFTVIADAAMISQDNIDQLVDKKLHYIVGARLGNLSQKLIDQIDRELNRKDKATIRISTPRGFLICSFSDKRYRKDKHDTEKQIDKAKAAIQEPGKQKRLKFIFIKHSQPKLNQKLIDKTRKLWGIKGYYTNLKKMSNQKIIDQYQQLWNVEKSFRITKSDLQARPIYLRKTDAVKAHVLICFMALAIAKHMEIQSDMSVRKCIDLLKSVKDAKIKNQFDQIVTLRSKIPPDVENFLSLSH